MDLADGHTAALRKLFTTESIGDQFISFSCLVLEMKVDSSSFWKFLRVVLNVFVLSGCVAYNLGTGCGTSVLEMVAAFEKASGKVNVVSFLLSPSRSLSLVIKLLGLKLLQKIPIKLCPRRPGDATAVYASTEKAQRELGWKYAYDSHLFPNALFYWNYMDPLLHIPIIYPYL